MLVKFDNCFILAEPHFAAENIVSSEYLRTNHLQLLNKHWISASSS